MTYIKEIANLRSGVFTKPTGQAEAFYLQAGHFDAEGRFDPRVKPALEVTQKLQKDLLTRSDILFASKGSRNFAVVHDDTIGPAIASTSFIVIRVNPTYQEQVLPEYVCWFMNQPQTQTQIKSFAKGTFIPAVTMKSIADLKISIPDLETQQLILEVSALRYKEKHLRTEIDTLTDQLLQEKLITLAHQE
ncbi:MAG: restriction endonuclease subunit S [Ignavibacteriales bacterium]|nr:restriction endonuclease subunit S [Ignavibacteriales bacterium]